MTSWLREAHPLLKIGLGAPWAGACVFFTGVAPLACLAAGTAVLLICAGALSRSRALAYGLTSLALMAGIHLLIGGTPAEAAYASLRLIAFVGISAALSLSTDPYDLLQALRALPLPSGLLLGLTIMWRSVPALVREAQATAFACRLEGAPLTILRPRRLFRSLVVPLCFGVVGFADELSLALAARGITLDGRRLAVPPRGWRMADAIFLLTGAGSMGAAVFFALASPWR